MPDRPPTIVFLDGETTGLEPGRHEIWELALIVRTPGEEPQECLWQMPVSLVNADSTALRLNRFYERFDSGTARPQSEVLDAVARVTANAYMVGSIPSFDTGFLEVAMRRHNLAPAWHYRLVCVESLAAGALGQRPPWSTDDLGERLGVPKDKSDQHTAMGDARWAMKMYDAVMEMDRRPVRRGPPPAPAAPVPPPELVVIDADADEGDEGEQPQPPSDTEPSTCSECGVEVEARQALMSFSTQRRVLCMTPKGQSCYDRMTTGASQ